MQRLPLLPYVFFGELSLLANLARPASVLMMSAMRTFLSFMTLVGECVCVCVCFFNDFHLSLFICPPEFKSKDKLGYLI